MGVRVKRLGKGPSEAEFRVQVIDLAHLRGWTVAWFRPVRVQRKDGSIYYETPVGADGAGWPDIVLVRGRIVFAELKVGKEKPAPEQRLWHDKLTTAGAEVHVWSPADWSSIEKELE